MRNTENITISRVRKTANGVKIEFHAPGEYSDFAKLYTQDWTDEDLGVTYKAGTIAQSSFLSESELAELFARPEVKEKL